MISNDLRNVAFHLTTRAGAGGLSADDCAQVSRCLEALAKDVATLELQPVPEALKGDDAALDGNVTVLATHRRA